MSLSPRRAVDATSTLQGIYRPSINAVVLGVGVFIACLAGIFSRPGGDLASFWPANAFFIGMLVRYPHFAHRGGWLAAAIGFFAADALTGSSVPKNLLLTFGNLLTVAAGYAVFRRIDPAMYRLRNPLAVLYLLLAALCTASTAGLVGLFTNIYLFNDRPIDGFIAWFATETAADLAFLPLILTLPDWEQRPHHLGAWLRQHLTLRKALPAIALLLSTILGSIVGGPGAIAFPVPALMWCAVSYNLFTIALLTLVLSAWTLIHVASSIFLLPSGVPDRHLLLSARMGLMLVMLTPIMIGSVMAANRALVQKLRVLADLDPLTQLPSRRAFMEHAHTQVHALQQSASRCAVLMLDIDHFKMVNDRYGHAAGDAVLTHFGRLLRDCLRHQDIAGRLGGEEFAVLLPHTTEQDAYTAAERIRARFADSAIAINGLYSSLHCTVSIGIAVEYPTHSSLDVLLGKADQALYSAKANGRNRLAHFADTATANAIEGSRSDMLR